MTVSTTGIEMKALLSLTKWTTLTRQPRNADLEVHTSAIGIGARNDRAGDDVAVRESGEVLDSLRIAARDWRRLRENRGHEAGDESEEAHTAYDDWSADA